MDQFNKEKQGDKNSWQPEGDEFVMEIGNNVKDDERPENEADCYNLRELTY